MDTRVLRELINGSLGKRALFICWYGFWYWHGPRILGHLSIHLTTTASFLFLKILAWFYGVNLGRTKFLSSLLGGLVSYINLPVKLLASITKLADIFCNRLPVLCRDIRLQPGRLQDSISTSDANGPVLFWIGSVFQYSNLEPVRSFDWPNLDQFWSFHANRFTSKTRSSSVEP